MNQSKKIPEYNFFCTVSSHSQIFLPARMRKILGINPGDITTFRFKSDGTILFCKDELMTNLEKNNLKRT